MFFLLLIPVIFYSSSWVFMKKYQKNMGTDSFATAFYNMVGSLISFCILFCIKGFKIFWNWPTLICAVVFGCGLGIYNGFKVKAASKGPLALASMATTLGAVILTMLYGFIFLHESVTVMKIVAVILVIASFIPIILKQKEEKITAVFILFCVLLFLFNGVLTDVSKVAQGFTEDRSQTIDFICLYFFFCFLSSAVIFLLNIKKTKEIEREKVLDIPTVLVAVVAVAANTMAALANFYLAFMFEASIEFPVVNVGIMIMTTVMALIIYKEKPTVSTIIGLSLATASVICISL